jgi:hypothetical protein
MRKGKVITMKKTLFIIVVALIAASLAAQAGSAEQKKRTASDNAVMQSANPNMPTRVIKNGTNITMRFGSTVIPGILTESETAKALIAKLPYTVHVSRYSHDFCGVMNDPVRRREEIRAVRTPDQHRRYRLRAFADQQLAGQLRCPDRTREARQYQCVSKI